MARLSMSELIGKPPKEISPIRYDGGNLAKTARGTNNGIM